MGLERVARIITIAVVIAFGLLGIARPDAVLAGGIGWLAFLFFVCSGWGYLVVRASGVRDPDFGLRACYGLALYIAVAGVFVALGVCSRPVILLVIGGGAAGFAWRELVTDRPLWAMLGDAVRGARERPIVMYAAIVIGAIAVVHVLGAVARLDRNPWDDDLAYTPLAKRLLDCGDLIEPFSFRRLAAYGGHVGLEALAGARGTMANVHLVDQGLCYGIFALLAIGYARELSRVPGLWLGTIALVLVTLPDISINTASYWSGAVLLFALYRAAVRTDFVVAALLGAAACTLRQNYIPVAVVFLAMTMWRASCKRTVWKQAAIVAAAVLVPWCVASLRSSHTFLFPFVKGTWNHGLSLAPAGWSWVDELELLLSACANAQPIAVAVLIAPVIAFAGDDRPGRPLGSMLVASIIGFLLLVRSFADADTISLWRYAFGYATPLAIAFALELGSASDPVRIRISTLGRWVVLSALLVQLATTRTTIVKQITGELRDLREAATISRHGDPSARVEARRYAAMQAAVPPGERLAVMVDDPAYLDFRRNRIANLDTPGFASPGVQWPAFAGADALRAYFLTEGYRYVAFVRSTRSRYFFRREFWLWRMFNDNEFFQVQSAYVIDAIDALDALTDSARIVYDDDGLVVLDLDGDHGPVVALDPKDEPQRRDAYVRALAKREHLEREWSLITRKDLAFEDGISSQSYAQPGDDARWYDIFFHDPDPKRGQPIRWMSRRVHLRVRGERAMHLVMRGRVNPNILFTHPRFDVSLDGVLLGSVQTDDAGVFVIDLDVVPPHAWGDLYIVASSIGQPEHDEKDLRVARLEEVQWEPR